MRGFIALAMVTLCLPALAQDLANQQFQQQIAQQMTLNDQQPGYICHPNRLNVPMPTFSLRPGNYGTPQRVKLIDRDRIATIYYTIDGTTPTTSSRRFTRHEHPLLISSTTQIQAIAISCDGHSRTAGAVYTLAAQPVQAQPVQTPKAAAPATSYKPSPKLRPENERTKPSSV